MSHSDKDRQPVPPAPGIGDRAAVVHKRGPVIDIHPLPGTPEAKTLGCTCRVTGTGTDGKRVYSFTKGCPIRNHG